MAKLKDYLVLGLFFIYTAFRWIYMKAFLLLKRKWTEYWLEKMVKKALRLTKLEKRRYIVTTMLGRPRCFSKQDLKEALKRRKFKKGVTMEQIEQRAYFITTPGILHSAKAEKINAVKPK